MKTIPYETMKQLMKLTVVKKQIVIRTLAIPNIKVGKVGYKIIKKSK